MPFVISRLPDEPIVHVLIDVPLEQHMNSVTSIIKGLMDLARQSGSILYVVVDMTDQDPTVSDIHLAIDLLTPLEKWLTEPPVRSALVGNHPVLSVAVRRFQQQLDLEVQQYEQMDEALASIRAQIVREKQRFGCPVRNQA
jgi:hypothetical protein